MSHASAIANPPPTAAPLIAAITGWRRRWMRSCSDARCSWVRIDQRDRVHPLGARCAVLASTPFRSAPEQKPRPAPVRMTARTSRSPLIAIERVVQLGDQPLAERVEPLGTVHRDEQDAGLELLGEHH